MRILVCGDRKWTNRKVLYAHLDLGERLSGFDLLIEGEYKGADTMARQWAESRGIPVEPHPADWEKHGKAAGPIRNREMLKSKPHRVIAYHNSIATSKGTKDMVTIALKAGIPCVLVTEGGVTTFNNLESFRSIYAT